MLKMKKIALYTRVSTEDQAREGFSLDAQQEKRWDKKTVSRMLSNPVYCGLMEWEDVIVPGSHRAVTCREDFNRVQRLKRQRARRKGANFVLTSDLQKKSLH
ncbi:MAG: recombinase family protein [Candidatus Thermoplasmatota archaeon]|nr:recombinase family protein [Candidatus Thermoplasmatota archaeon]